MGNKNRALVVARPIVKRKPEDYIIDAIVVYVTNGSLRAPVCIPTGGRCTSYQFGIVEASGARKWTGDHKQFASR